VQLIDGKGRIAQAKLSGCDPRSATCIIQSIEHQPRLTPVIELATAIPKGPRGDAMINDLAQLGVDRLVPLTTKRSVVDPRQTKLDRFSKAAMESAKQSGRAWFMQIDAVTTFEQALRCDAELRLVADPYAGPIVGLHERIASSGCVRVLVGPEGGLTESELDQAKQAGFTLWTYSPHVLRVETAAAAAVAILRARA